MKNSKCKTDCLKCEHFNPNTGECEKQEEVTDRRKLKIKKQKDHFR